MAIRALVRAVLGAAAGALAGHACCVARGTRVSTPDGERSVESLRVGDAVVGIDLSTGARVVARIVAIRTARRECVALEADGRRLVCTPDHPIHAPCSGTFSPASRFVEGIHREVHVVDPETVRRCSVTRAELHAGVHDVYDVSLGSPPHNFVAEGFLVHNKTLRDYGTVAFVCDPSTSRNCPDDFTCCSDDPAAPGGELPRYPGIHEAGAAPLFAGINNDVGRSGMCVRVDDIPEEAGLSTPDRCPIPCNPLWSAEDIDAVCGPQRECCQTRVVAEADCVFDDEEQRWRTMDGRDAVAAAAEGAARWGRDGTHQDPDLDGCEAHAGAREGESFLDCARQLTVADQRGFCIALQPGQLCPTAQESYIDACEERNG